MRQPGKPKHNADKAKVKAWLKAHGHKAADVDRLVADVSTPEALRAALCALHGVNIEQYRAARVGAG